MKVTSIILVDDHKMIRDGIKTFIEGDKSVEVIGEANNGIECLDLLDALTPDIVITDLNMPEMDGIELTRQIAMKHPEVKVIALTMFGESQHVKQTLAEGAMGYLLKDCREDELRLAIRKVSSGSTYYSPEVTKTIINKVRKVKTQTSSRIVLEVPLTDREKEVLYLIVREFSNQEIADKLFISIRTVEAHKRNILDKTGSKTVAGLVLYAIEKQLFDDI